MPDKPKHSGLPAPPNSLLARLGEQFRLSWRLFQDNRVPLRVKLIPILGIAYLVSPFGLIPALIPVIGQIDAFAVTLLVVAWFNYAAPRATSEEHLLYLRSRAKPVRRAMRDDGSIFIENRIHFTDEIPPTDEDSATVSEDVDLAEDLQMNGDETESATDSSAPEPDTSIFTKRAK